MELKLKAIRLNVVVLKTQCSKCLIRPLSGNQDRVENDEAAGNVGLYRKYNQ